MANLARVLGRLPVSSAVSGEDLLLLLERLQPLAAQTLLQHGARSPGTLGGCAIQCTQNRWLARGISQQVADGSSNAQTSHQQGVLGFPPSLHNSSSSRDQQQRHCLTSSAVASAAQQPSDVTSVSDSVDNVERSLRLQGRQQPQQHPDEQQLPSARSEAAAAPPFKSQLELSIITCPTLSSLAKVVAETHLILPPELLLMALNKLAKLHKEQQQQQQRRQQQQQQQDGAQPEDTQQQQQQQQQQDEPQLLQVTLGLLLTRIQQVHSSLPPYKVVQVVYCLSQLGPSRVVDSLAGSTDHYYNLLSGLLRQLCGSTRRITKQLPLLAKSLADLRATSVDILAADSTASNDVTTATTTTSSSSSSSDHSTTVEQQQAGCAAAAAVAEVARQLVMELCQTVQQVPVPSLMTEQRSDGYDAAGIAKFVSSMARLGHYDWQAMRHITQLAKTQAKDMSASNLASVLAGLARLHHYDEQLCTLLADAAETAMPAASGSQAAMIMWAMATLKVDHPGVFAAAARQAILRSGQLEPRHISNLAWAFTVRKAFHPGLFDALAARVLQLGLEDFEPHHLSLLAWSFAKQGLKVEGLMQALGDQAAVKAEQLLPQNISNLAWAFGCLSISHPQLFAALAGAAKSVHLEGFGNQNMTDLAWGCAATGFKDSELFDLLSRATINNMNQMSAHSLSDITYAFAALQHPSAAAVLSAAAPAAVARIERFSFGMLSDLLWAYGAVQVRDEELLQAAAAVLPQRTWGMSADMRSTAKVLWALKKLKYRNAEMEQQLAEVIPNIAELLGSQNH